MTPVSLGQSLTDSSKALARLNNLFHFSRRRLEKRTLDNTETVRRHLVGSIVGVASALVLGFAMLPLRSHISVSTAALVLVIPVVFGSVIGGIKAGVASVVAGFLVYDYGYIPPYKTLDVGTPQNWAALAVYVIVMLLVASVVASLDSSRVEAQRGGEAARHLSELSEHLVGDRSGRRPARHHRVRGPRGISDSGRLTARPRRRCLEGRRVGRRTTLRTMN